MQELERGSSRASPWCIRTKEGTIATCACSLGVRVSGACSFVVSFPGIRFRALFQATVSLSDHTVRLCLWPYGGPKTRTCVFVGARHLEREPVVNPHRRRNDQHMRLSFRSFGFRNRKSVDLKTKLVDFGEKLVFLERNLVAKAGARQLEREPVVHPHRRRHGRHVRLSFRVSCLGFRVSGWGRQASDPDPNFSDFGLRIRGVGLNTLGSGFRVQGSGFRVQGLGFRVQDSGFRVQVSGCRVQGSGCRVQGEGREAT